VAQIILRSSVSIAWLPEFLISRGKLAAIDRAWRRQPVHADSFTEEDIAPVRACSDKKRPHRSG